MIHYVQGDLFDAPAETLVNPVNCVGVMGSGLALAFKRRYPAMFREYQKLCAQQPLRVGQLWLYRAPDRRILNFPTKTHWRYPSKIEYIAAGLETFVQHYRAWHITSIAFPKLGCGRGGLDWTSEVQPLMIRYLEPLPIDVYIYIT